MSPLVNSHDLAARLIKGDRRALARAISLVETGGADARILLAAVYPHSGRAHSVGITGSPGAGKSTLVTVIAQELRQRGRSVGILAVDPSSPFTGGALLGDRIRMQTLGGDPAIFIRSMASRGRLGGLARATDDAIVLLDAAGFDVVLVETVGAGQGEVDIARTAQTTLVVEVPGMGDDVQSIKAGMLEIADLFVVNKADRDGAEQVARSLRTMLNLGGARTSAWKPPVLMAVATRNEGAAAIVDALDQHKAYNAASADLTTRAWDRAERELRAVVGELAIEQLQNHSPERWQQAIEAVAARQSDPYSAALLLVGVSK